MSSSEEDLQLQLDKKYQGFSQEEKEELYKMLYDKDIRGSLREQLESILFIHKPPTPEEFLDPAFGFLPESYINDLYPHVREDFINAMSRDNPYAIISLYGSVRTGKSVTARLFTMYTIVWVNYLRDPHMYYKISQMSRLCIYLVSFKDDKTKQVYLSPLLNLLEASPKFKRVHFERYVGERGVTNDGVIHFSEASKFGSITFPKVSIVCGKDASSLVGADIIAGAISELTFFKEYVPGMSDEEVVQVFTKLSTRIKNTVGLGSFPCWTYIDSSANDASSPLEKMILQDLQNDPTCYYRHYVLWELRPYLFPVYHKTGKTFNVCTGDGNTPAKIIEDDEELAKLPAQIIIKVPIDLRKDFERNLIDQIKDVAGRPTNNEQKFIQAFDKILKIFDNPILENEEGVLVIDAADKPEKLIWNQVHHRLFTMVNGEYLFKRAPDEPRWIHVDIAKAVKGDLYGLAIMHLEKSRVRGLNMQIFDLACCFKSGTTGINLSAMYSFIMELIEFAKVPISSFSSDTFQNAQLLQDLKRHEINCVEISVDRTLDPYMYLLSCLYSETIKAGKNIFLKNNLNSLYRTRRKTGTEKIDHLTGSKNITYLGDFNNSDCGKNMKDVSDAVCGASFCSFQSEYQPTTIYEDENTRMQNKPEDMSNLIQQAYKKLHRYY